MSKNNELQNPWLMIGLVVMLGVVALLGSDMPVPALPAMAADLQTTTQLTRLSITIYLLGLAITPLFAGPFADKYGRRKLILIGGGFGIIGSVICALSGNIELLLAGRFIQGAGLGVAAALSRTVARDLFSGKKLAEIGSIVSFCMALGPAFAPLIGSYIQHSLSWQAIFWSLLAYTSVVCLLIYRFFPETNKHLNPNATKPKHIIANYLTLIKSPIFMGNVVASSMATASIYVFYTMSPFILQNQLGLSVVEFGWVMMAVTAMMLVSRIINIPLVRHFRIRHCILFGLGLMLFGSSLLFVFALLGFNSVASIITPVMIIVLGTGLVFSNAMAAAFTPFKHIGGSAGALYSSLQMFGSFIMTGIASLLPNSHVSNLSWLLLVISLFAVTIFILSQRQYSKSRQALQQSMA